MAISDKTLLIVDDMKSVRMKLKLICAEMGITKLFEAVDGAQALDVLAKEKIDLVLSDWNMPKMTGIEMLKEIRKRNEYAGIPVIFITAENEKSSILMSLVSGVTDYIVKPFPDDLVKQKIFSALKNT